MNSAKVASYITITLFVCTTLGFLINYSKSFVRKGDIIILEERIKEISIKCNAIANLYKIRNIQERI